jgi:L-asparagine oxygenase
MNTQHQTNPSFTSIESNLMNTATQPRTRDELAHLRIRAERRETVRQMVEQGIHHRSYMVDVEADTMAFTGAAALAHGVSTEDKRRLLDFGRGQGAPFVVLEGGPSQSNIPNTPQGFGDDTQVLFADTMLLGAMRLAGLHPIAFSYENFGRLMRNVAPSKQAENSVSSHGAKLPLEWHTDNAYAFEHGYRSPMGLRLASGMFGHPIGSPSPRFLCFVSLRNHDAQGDMVPTELLRVDDLLETLPQRLQRKLRQPIFEIKPGASNERASMKRMPLLESCSVTGKSLLRFNANEGQTLGLTPGARGAVVEVSQRLTELERRAIPIYLQPGELLMFDNYRVLHRRGSFEPGPLQQARWLRRCFGTSDTSLGEYVDREHRPFVWS